MKSVYKIPQKIKCLTDERKRKSIPLFNIVMPVLLFLMLQYESFHTIFSAPESMSKRLKNCLSRKKHTGETEYFYRSVVCMITGKSPHVILGQEMLKPRDGSGKDEGKLTGGKRLIERLKKRHGHFADVIVISECSIYQHSEGKWSGRGDTPERRKKNDFSGCRASVQTG
jgi:hypothetical protein